LEKACCGTFRKIDDRAFTPGTTQHKRFVAFRRAGVEVEPEQDFSRLVLSALANRGRAIDAQTLFMGVMEAMDESGQPIMSEAELRHPLQYLLLNQLVRPLIEGAIPMDVAAHLGTGLGNIVGGLAAAERPTADIGALSRRVEELTNIVQSQQATINTLLARLPHN
jgi:hypothetical protein